LLLANQNSGIGFWQTEYSILGGDYLEGRNQSDLNVMDYSLWIARIMHWDLTIANATGWSWWTSLSYPKFGDHKNRFGLLNWYPDSESRSNSSGQIEVTKNLWAFGNFSRFIRPGYKRVDVSNDLFGSLEVEAANLMVSAYVSPGEEELVIVFINYSTDNLSVPILNYGTEDGFTVIEDTFDMYLTNQTNNLTYSIVNSAEITIKGKSIVTLVGKL
jgi:O-glycosyl hydrolase